MAVAAGVESFLEEFKAAPIGGAPRATSVPDQISWSFTYCCPSAGSGPLSPGQSASAAARSGVPSRTGLGYQVTVARGGPHLAAQPGTKWSGRGREGALL